MSVCEHCEHRSDFGCGDGWYCPKFGCEDFNLDFKTLTKKQQASIRKFLSKEENNNYDLDLE